MERNANVTVYIILTKKTLKRKQIKFREKISRFLVTEFVKTCDELFIALNIGKR